MQIFIYTGNCPAIVSKQGVEKRAGCDNTIYVDNCVLLEHDLEDWYHHHDVTEGKSDKCHRFNDHLE